MTSPFLPWILRKGEAEMTDNASRAWESGKGVNQVRVLGFRVYALSFWGGNLVLVYFTGLIRQTHLHLCTPRLDLGSRRAQRIHYSFFKP